MLMMMVVSLVMLLVMMVMEVGVMMDGGDDDGGGNGSPSWFPFLHPLTLVSARLLFLVRLQSHHYALLRQH